jgi:MSHA pilin protein MshD
MFITRTARQRGMSLIELIVSIVVIGVAVTGVLAAITASTRASTDPMIQKQALAVAEAVMEEVQLMPFTFCDPDDANAATAADTAGCASANENNLVAEALDVPPTGPAETRAGTERPFDNVNDYNGFNMGPGISNLSGTAITGLGSYSAAVTVANQALGAIPAAESLLITVTVTGPGNTTVVLHGYRTRYAPNALP